MYFFVTKIFISHLNFSLYITCYTLKIEYINDFSFIFLFCYTFRKIFLQFYPTERNLIMNFKLNILFALSFFCHLYFAGSKNH